MSIQTNTTVELKENVISDNTPTNKDKDDTSSNPMTIDKESPSEKQPTNCEKCDVLVFNTSNGTTENTSLQDAFIKYKSQRQKEIKKSRKRREVKNEVQLRALANPDNMWRLRMKFMDQLRKYFGVPYAKRYWKPDEPEYSSRVFLDCCGLIRRVLRDLQKDFGFRIGPWNQGYMYDTLPITVEREDDMKPGDLVFISATYFNPKLKKQPHKMTHVEIWLGEGPKTIGSRWHRGHVGIFDSYSFEAKSYHTQTYHFKSIDTWLMGICRSHCKEHPWKTRAEKFKPGKKSIFSIKQKPSDQQDSDEAASDTDAEKGLDRGKSAPMLQQHVKPSVKKNGTSRVVSSKSSPPGASVLNEEEDDDDDDSDMLESGISTPDIGSDVSSLRSSELSFLNHKYRESPNSQRDFATKVSNPGEGKEVDLKLVLSSNGGELVDLLEGHMVGESSQISDGDRSSTSSGKKTPRDLSSIIMTFDSESQTGVNNEGTCFHALGEDKWVSANNVLCYASMCNGEAAVQVKTPDLITVDSSGSDSEGGYSAQEQSVVSDESNHTNEEEGESKTSEDKINTEETGDNDDDDAMSVGACSMYPRVGSATSHRSFIKPDIVGPLYTGFSQESSSSSSCYSSANEALLLSPKDTTICEDDNQDEGDLNEGDGDLTESSHHNLNDSSEESSMGDTEPLKSARRDGRRNRRAVDEMNKQQEGTKRSRINALAQPKDPTFYIAGGNGVGLVEAALTELGWKRITNKYDDTYKLKWVECKSAINYNLFKQGEQLVNRIPNCSLLTNKLGLLNSLQRFERISTYTSSSENKLRSTEFLPETYRIDDATEKQMFFDIFQDGELWICKPCGLNQGKGIYLVRNLEEFKKNLEEREEKVSPSKRPMERIIQKYLSHPLLLDNKKFDIRAYMLIASTTPYLVCYHKGYVRLCLYKYKLDSENMIGHLTNQFIQKKDTNYQENKEDTVWSMDKFNQYINENIAQKKGLETDWVYTTLTNQMKQIMQYCFNAVKHKLKCRPGFFDLYGFDFMVDEDMKLWLIEVNANPCLAVNCQSLVDIVPGVVRESLYLAIECFEKSRKGQPLHPLHCLTNCQIIYDGTASRQPRTRPISPKQRTPYTARSNSPRMRSQSPINRRQTGSPYKDILSNPMSQSTPGPIQATNVTIVQGSQPSSKMEEHFKGTTRIYNTAMPRSVTPRIPASFIRLPKATSVASTSVGLRGALPLTTKLQPPVAEFENNIINPDVFKFKMTHAALMSSIRSENVKSAQGKRGGQSSDNTPNITSRSELINSTIPEVDKKKAEFHRSASRAIEEAHSNLDLYMQRLGSPSPMVKEAPQIPPPESGNRDKTGGGHISNNKNNSSNDKVTTGHSESDQYLGGQSAGVTEITHNAQKTSKGATSRGGSPTKLNGVGKSKMLSSQGAVSPYSKMMTSAPSIPTLKKEGGASDGTKSGGIVGISIKKNERGS